MVLRSAGRLGEGKRMPVTLRDELSEKIQAGELHCEKELDTSNNRQFRWA